MGIHKGLVIHRNAFDLLTGLGLGCFIATIIVSVIGVELSWYTSWGYDIPYILHKIYWLGVALVVVGVSGSAICSRRARISARVRSLLNNED